MFALPFCHVAAPRRTDVASLAVAAAAAALAALLALSLSLPLPLPLRTANSPVSQPLFRHAVVTLQDAGVPLPALRDEAEAVRARLLAVPGIGAVRLHGLLTAGLEVDYTPARLARLGVTASDLLAAVPAQTQSAGGRILLRPEAVQDGPQPIADRMVHAAGRIFRLGDIATVSRIAIGPACILSRNGQPAVELEIVPAPGTAGVSLDRPIAAALDRMALPKSVTLR